MNNIIMGKTIINISIVSVAVLQVLLLGSVAAAPVGNIFKCTNQQGEVYYNDKPCPVDNEEKRIQSEKDVVNGYVPSGFNKEQLKSSNGKKVGGNKTRTIGSTPDKNVENESRSEDDDPSTNKGSSVNNGSSTMKAFSDLSSTTSNKKGLQSDKSNKNLAPPKAKIAKRSGPDGKLSVQEKRALLGISPVER